MALKVGGWDTALVYQHPVDQGEQVIPADPADEIPGHSRIIPLAAPFPDEPLEPGRISVSGDAPSQRTEGVLGRIEHLGLDGSLHRPSDAKASALPVGLIGLGFHRQLMLVCLDGFLILLHGLDQIRFSYLVCQFVAKILFGDIIDAVFQEQVHRLFKKRITGCQAVPQQLGRKIHRIFHFVFLQVLFQFILGPVRRPQPFPVKRCPQLVVQRRGTGQLHLIGSQHRKMAAWDFRKGFLLGCRRQGIFRCCRSFLRSCCGFCWSSAFRNRRRRWLWTFRGGRALRSQAFRDLRSAVITEFGVIRQFGAAVHAKHRIILSPSGLEVYSLILWAAAFSWRACISVRTRLARSTWRCSLR